MDDEEAKEILAGTTMFWNLLGERARDLVIPDTPKSVEEAMEAIESYASNPTEDGLARLCEISSDLPRIEKEYFDGIACCEQALDNADLMPGIIAHSKEINEAMRTRFRSKEQQIRKHGNVHRASIFAESKLGEFAHSFGALAGEAYVAVKNTSVSKGGVIYYTDRRFDINFLPNMALAYFEDLVSGFRSGDAKSTKELSVLVSERAKLDVENMTRLLPERKFLEMYAPVALALVNFSHGKFTRELENYMRRLMSRSYALPDDVFHDDSLFAEGSRRRLFSVLISYIDPAHATYTSDQEGPDERDIGLSWKIGPEVILMPKDNKLGVHFISRGKTQKIGEYSFDS